MKLKFIIRKLHLWLGLMSGVIIFIIGTTGCILVFEQELKQLLYKERNEVNVTKEKLPISKLKKIAATAVHTGYPLNSVIIPQTPNRSYIFRSRYKNEEALTYFGHIEYYHQVYINPYTGKILENENGKFEFFHFVTWLHIGLLLSYKVGTIITSIAVSIFIILLITGMFLWWPKNKSLRKKRFSFQWKPTTGNKRKNYDLHSILGFYASFVLLIIAVTGLVWSFEWVGSCLQWVANGGEIITTSAKPKMIKNDMSIEDPLDKVFYQLKTLHPDAHEFHIALPKGDGSDFESYSQMTEGKNYRSVTNTFNPKTAMVESQIEYVDLSKGEKLDALNYDIHTGSIFSIYGKILAFLASLIAASLPLTGFLMWWGRNKKKAKTKNNVDKSSTFKNDFPNQPKEGEIYTS